jgi:hypothetical protein
MPEKLCSLRYQHQYSTHSFTYPYSEQLPKTFEETPMYQAAIYDNHYHGMPLSTNHGQFLASRLDDALATIDGAMAESTRLVMSVNGGVKMYRRGGAKVYQ